MFCAFPWLEADAGMPLTGVHLVERHGGKSGSYVAG
jgi:hypothetical protein